MASKGGAGGVLGGWFKRGEADVSTTQAPDASTSPDESRPLDDEATPIAVRQLRVDPGRCRIWPGNARVYALLTPDNCRELIDSIVAEGAQRLPAIVRPLADDPDHDYEVIVGTRRHFAISWLRGQGGDIGFLVQIEDLDDEAAFRLADLENRSRHDVSDLERARNYAAALTTHYDKHLTRMAERLNLSKGWLSKMIKVAALPDTIFAAFADLRELKLKPAYALARAADRDGALPMMIATAQQIARAQAARRDDNGAPYPAAEVVRILLDAAGTGGSDALYRHAGKDGRPAVTVTTASRHGITIKLHSGSGLDRAALLKAVGAAIDRAADAGITLD